MTDLQKQLAALFSQAITRAFGPEHADTDPLVRPAANPQFGDYQANIAMGLAKKVGRKPREVAERIVEALPREGLIEKAEIAGPGFINLTLAAAALGELAAAMLADDRLGVPRVADPKTVVVDYSGPNVAKEMHIGHLRATAIGDVIARVVAFEGHQVIGQNHLGDWGTQFGMLIEHLIEQGEAAGAAAEHRAIGDLNVFYQTAKRRFDAEPDFAERARQRVVKLQSGDGETLARWRQLVEESKRHFDAIYERLDIDTDLLQYRPESSYNEALPGVIEDLEAAGQLQESQGAKVVYPAGFKDRDGRAMPMIVQKSDGGYLYATTDLAAARHRLQALGADRIIYVTDVRQSQHFAMIFKTLRQAGWATEAVRLDHVPFGTILGKDKKPFKTRSGDTVKLVDVLDEAEERARAIIQEKNPELPEAQRRRIAHIIGVGAVKYADLSTDRIKDYVFDFDRMLAFEGNTAPYLQNAFVRIRSIFRKGLGQGVAYRADGAISVADPAERALVLQLAQLPQVVAGVADSLEPHRLCNYLFDLAAAYHRFYEGCPVLAAADEATRASRLRLSDLTARTLQQGLTLLGIQTVDQM